MKRYASLLPIALGAQLLAAMPLTAALRALPGTLTLPLDDPILPVEIAGVRLRLRVDFDAGSALVLNPDAAARLPLRFVRDVPVEVGRVRLEGRKAEADVRIDGRLLRTDVSSYEQPCCSGADGMISPELLPYAEIRLIRAGAPAFPPHRLLLEVDSEAGIYAPVRTPQGAVRVRFALSRATSDASRSAGVMIASAVGGRLDDARFDLAAPFGVTRPASMLRLARPFDAAGFRLGEVAVRIADFGGHRRFSLAAPPGQPGDIVVRHRADIQQEWPALTLGRDVLGACSSIAYAPAARTISFSCPGVPPS